MHLRQTREEEKRKQILYRKVISCYLTMNGITADFQNAPNTHTHTLINGNLCRSRKIKLF